MAEIATIARPYAQALFKAAGDNAPVMSEAVGALAAVAADPQMRQFADNPKAGADQVFNVISDVLGRQGWVLSSQTQNFLRTVIENGRLGALPEIARQFHELVNARSGVSDAIVESAFAIGDAQLGEVVATLEKRFGRRLNATVRVAPELIGGIRVTVGDEVLDTSVKARLEQMKIALTA
jgi:F-type H+-transporting ATPase subunit delta